MSRNTTNASNIFHDSKNESAAAQQQPDLIGLQQPVELLPPQAQEDPTPCDEHPVEPEVLVELANFLEELPVVPDILDPAEVATEPEVLLAAQRDSRIMTPSGGARRRAERRMRRTQRRRSRSRSMISRLDEAIDTLGNFLNLYDDLDEATKAYMAKEILGNCGI